MQRNENSSAAKLRTWERIRELDRRALALMAAGADLTAAYTRAMDEQQIARRGEGGLPPTSRRAEDTGDGRGNC